MVRSGAAQPASGLLLRQKEGRTRLEKQSKGHNNTDSSRVIAMLPYPHCSPGTVQEESAACVGPPSGQVNRMVDGSRAHTGHTVVDECTVETVSHDKNNSAVQQHPP